MEGATTANTTAMIDTAAQTIAAVQARLPPDIGNYFSTEDYVAAYNDALDEISDATEFFESWVGIKLRKWAVYADLRGLLPTTVLRVTAVWNVATQRWLYPTNTRELDETVGPGWEKQVGPARNWFMRGLWFLGMFPTAGDDSSLFRVYFSSLMQHVEVNGSLATGLTVRPPLVKDLTGAVEDYMLSSLLGDRGESKKALEHWADYKEQEMELGRVGKERMSRDNVPRMGLRR